MARYKLNVLTGLFDLVGDGSSTPSPPNFSYKYIPSGESVTIPVNQQMIVLGGIVVDGELIIDGELALI